jgi:hypothetical protein
MLLFDASSSHGAVAAASIDEEACRGPPVRQCLWASLGAGDELDFSGIYGGVGLTVTASRCVSREPVAALLLCAYAGGNPRVTRPDGDPHVGSPRGQHRDLQPIGADPRRSRRRKVLRNSHAALINRSVGLRNDPLVFSNSAEERYEENGDRGG